MIENKKDSDPIPPEILDLLRFMCQTWDAIDSWVYKYCDNDAIGKYPVIQGTSNQIKIRRIGTQDINKEKLYEALNWMQRYNK